MWELDYKESWAPKNRCFSTVALEKTLESPLYCKKIKPSWRKSVLNIHWKLKLKLQYFGHLMQRTDSLEKTLMLGKIEGTRRGQQRMRWLDGITNSMDMGLSKLWELGDGQGSLACRSPWFAKNQTGVSDWTELISTGVFQTKLTLSSSLLFSHLCDWNHHLLGCSRWNLGCYLRALSLSHYLTTSHQFYLVKFFI